MRHREKTGRSGAGVSNEVITLAGVAAARAFILEAKVQCASGTPSVQAEFHAVAATVDPLDDTLPGQLVAIWAGMDRLDAGFVDLNTSHKTVWKARASFFARLVTSALPPNATPVTNIHMRAAQREHQGRLDQSRPCVDGRHWNGQPRCFPIRQRPGERVREMQPKPLAAMRGLFEAFGMKPPSDSMVSAVANGNAEAVVSHGPQAPEASGAGHVDPPRSASSDPPLHGSLCCHLQQTHGGPATGKQLELPIGNVVAHIDRLKHSMFLRWGPSSPKAQRKNENSRTKMRVDIPLELGPTVSIGRNPDDDADTAIVLQAYVVKRVATPTHFVPPICAPEPPATRRLMCPGFVPMLIECCWCL